MTRETYQEAIRRHYARGMGRAVLERIYGPCRVAEVLGAAPEMVEQREAPTRPSGPPTFQQRIRKVMHDLRVTVAKFAVICGVDRHTVDHWRAGIATPVSRHIIKRVADVMNMEADELAREIAAERQKRGVGPKTGNKRQYREAAE